jgi:hypothetical protein
MDDFEGIIGPPLLRNGNIETRGADPDPAKVIAILIIFAAFQMSYLYCVCFFKSRRAQL